MRALVTGANGFIGRALCARILQGGDVRVWAAVRDACAAALPVGVTPLEMGDISERSIPLPCLPEANVLVHLAGCTNLMIDRLADPLAEYRRFNLHGTENLARQAALAGVSRFVFISSIKVNGEATVPGQPFTPAHTPTPQHYYGLTKHEAEQALRQIAQETGMEVVIIRPPLVYGPGVKGNFLRLIHAIDRGWPLPVGGIRNKRSLIYLGNLVDIIHLCMTHPKAAGKTFLVGDGDDVSTPELVRRISASLGRQPLLLPVPVSCIRLAGGLLGRQAAVNRLLGSLCVDTTTLREELGWTPQYNMREGLKATAQWYRKTKAEV